MHYPGLRAETPVVIELLKTTNMDDFNKLLRKYAGTKIKVYESGLLSGHVLRLGIKRCSIESPTDFASCLKVELGQK